MASVLCRRSYEEHVTCPVCMDLLSDPRTLPCMHTYCMECLNSYITSVNKASDEKGFKCAVCKAFTKPPFKGMHPYSWAENFPLNFALKGVVDEMKSKQRRGCNTTRQTFQNVRALCASHDDRVVEFECSDHDARFCSLCAALFHRKCENVIFLNPETHCNATPKIEPKTGEPEMKHKVVTRSSQAGPGDCETSVAQSSDSELLTRDFALAKSIVEVTSEDSSCDYFSGTPANHSLQKTSNDNGRHERPSARKPLKRLCALSSTDNIPNEDRNKDNVTGGTHFGTDPTLERHPLVESPHANVNNNAPDQQLATNTLYDIQEEDEDIISVSIDQNISKSHIMLSREVYVRSQSDTKCCSITGICSMPNGSILLADEANLNVKLFNASGSYHSYIQLESEPWDVTAIEQFEAAVSCPAEKMIHIILVNGSLSITRTICLDKKCYGLMYHDGEIYVAMENELRILSYEGKTLCRISSTMGRKKLFPLSIPIPKSLFRSARHISVNSLEKDIVIVVSDIGKRCVTSLMRNGKIVSRLRLGEEGVPSGVSVGEKGDFYVCQAPNRLIAISSDEHGNRIKHLLDLDLIQRVHFHKTSKKLWVARKAHNFVMVYTI